VIVGREAVCNVTVDDPMASRRHCAVGWERQRLWVKDLESSNGTWHNGRRLGSGKAVRLELGDRLRVGETLLTVLDDTDDAARDEVTGTEIAGHRIIERLGASTMGTVYRALQLSLDREVGLTLLAPALAREPGVRARFLGQARAAGHLVHPGLIRVFDVGEEGMHAFYTMELVEGGTLADVLRDGEPTPVDGVLRIAREVLEALAYAEELDIPHGQLTPSSLRRARSDALKIAGQGFSPPPGLGLVTPYTAPELLSGGDADRHADLYALGAILYHLLAGDPPFQSRRFSELRERIELDAPAPVTAARPETPPALATLVMELLEKDPAVRPGGAREALDRLGGAQPRGSGSHDDAAAGRDDGARALPSNGWQRWAYPVAGALAVVALVAALWPDGDAPAPQATPAIEARGPEASGPPESTGPPPERVLEAKQALAAAESWLREHPDLPAEAAGRFRDVAERFADIPEVETVATGRTDTLAALAAQLAQELDLRREREEAAERAVSELAQALEVAAPARLAVLRGQLVRVEAEHMGTRAVTHTAALRTRWDARAAEAVARLEREVRDALRDGLPGAARDAVARAGDWDLGAGYAGRIGALGAEVDAWVAARREAETRAETERLQRDLALLAGVEQPELVRDMRHGELADALARVRARLSVPEAIARCDARLDALRAQEQLLRHLSEHVAAERIPRITAQLAAGMTGVAHRVDSGGITYRGSAGDGIEVTRAWRQHDAAELERVFARVPLTAQERYGLGHSLLDLGAPARASVAFGVAVELAEAEGLEALRKRARAALAGQAPGRP
jgi:hypothetical protein